MQIHITSLFSDTKDWPRLPIWNQVVKVLLIVLIVIISGYILNNVYRDSYQSFPKAVYSFESNFSTIEGKITPCVVQFVKDRPGSLSNPFAPNDWVIKCSDSTIGDDTQSVVFRYKALAGKPIYGTDQEVIEAMVKSGDADKLAVKYADTEPSLGTLALLVVLGIALAFLMYLVYYHFIYRTILYLVLRLRKNE